MNLLRFILPFLFVRNWHDGAWEFSRMRCLIFGAVLVLVLVGVMIMYVLHLPVVYTSPKS
jgi:hypothetical protein